MPNTKDTEGSALGINLRNIRQSRSLTLNDVSKLSGVSPSTISKIENGVISTTYGNLLRLAKGLNIDISDLVTPSEIQPVTARFALTRKNSGLVHSIGTHDYELLCTQLINKKMVPMIARIRARSINELSGLNSHSGEEVMFVVSGKVTLHTEHYEPLHLVSGDCVYFDSVMGHATLSGTKEEAVVFWVCSSESSVDMLSEMNRKTPKGKKKTQRGPGAQRNSGQTWGV